MDATSPLVAPPLAAAGHSVVHARDLGFTGQTDAAVLAAAESDQRVLLTLDTDFGALVAAARCQAEHRVLPGGGDPPTRRSGEVAAREPGPVRGGHRRGAVVVIGDDRVRVRRLPIEWPPTAYAHQHVRGTPTPTVDDASMPPRAPGRHTAVRSPAPQSDRRG